MEPIKALFRSRKFLLALFAVVQALVFSYFDVPDALWQAIAALVSVLIASIAYEDGQEKSAKRAAPLGTTTGGTIGVGGFILTPGDDADDA